MSYPINSLLFRHGAFTGADAVNASQVAAWYTTGLLFASLVKLLTPTFFALKDSATPVIISVSSIILNILLSVILMGPYSYNGLAIANSIATLVNFTLLYVMLKRKIGALEEKALLVSFLKITAAALVMGFAVYGISLLFGDPESVWLRLAQVLISIIAGIGIFVITAGIFKSEETGVYIEALKRRLKKNK